MGHILTALSGLGEAILEVYLIAALLMIVCAIKHR
jgi:hypothetical protein